MSQNFIPGYLSQLTVDAQDFTVFSQTASLNLTKTMLEKAVMGTKFPVQIAGQRAGTLEASGHISVEASPLLHAAWDSDTPIAWVFQEGDPTSPTAEAQYAGTGIVSSFVPASDAADEVSFTITITLDAEPTYTPATP